MQKYKIFAGLGGGFGGATLCDTARFPTKDAAEEYAWSLACQIYEDNEGNNGLQDWIECQDEAEQEFSDIDDDNRDEFENRIEQIYNEARESWLDYWVELVEE